MASHIFTWLLPALLLLASLLSPWESPTSAVAAAFLLSGKVTDQSANPVSGTTVVAISTTTGTTIATTTSDSTGNYTLSVESGTYNIQATPPSGTTLQSSIVLNQAINAGTTLNIVLESTGSVALEGRVLDAQGIPLANEQVVLTTTTSPAQVLFQPTDGSGHYAFGVVAAGDYWVGAISNSSQSTSAAVPTLWQLYPTSKVTLDSTTKVLDFLPPLKQVSVHVQDKDGKAVGNAGITTTDPQQNNLSMGALTVRGTSGYPGNQPNLPVPHTDANGNVTLWLFPTTTTPYAFTVTPPDGSPYVTKSQSVSFTDNTTVTITLTPTLEGQVRDARGTR